MLDVRPSPIAGTWYEADPTILARIVDGYLDDAQLPELDGEVIAVIAPHAGYQYSGAVAGYAFGTLRDASTASVNPPLSASPKLVAVIAPMHHPYSPPLITSAHDAYSTPLGDVPIDKDAVRELDEALKSDFGFGLSPVSNDPEHSLEIELPFLQRALNSGWKLLPVMVRAQESRVSEALGKALAGVLANKNYVLVASTDLSHFYNQKTALNYDRAMLDQIESFSPEGAFDLERARKGFACGLGAFTAVLWASRQLGADKVKVLRHATSGDVTGDYSSVVGYGAAVILKR
ncbi:MAG: AmmeMemoRadiSam system protein B [Chloroflexota bacterium]|nr:AmmeMemoRadiSam system protein B [Chloroflexota bacterium]